MSQSVAAPQEMASGSRIIDQLQEAIDRNARFVLILSNASIVSAWVAAEIALAIAAERRKGRRVLFPIRICDQQVTDEWRLPDPESGEDLAEKIREYFIPDFAGWEDSMKLGEAATKLANELRRR
jgi:hypothetical protein